MPRLHNYAALPLAIATLWTVDAHATDGYFLHGTGAAAKGAGGVAIALPQDASSVATNPATATEIEQSLDIGVDVFVPNRGASIRGNAFGLDGDYSGNGANPFVLGDISYVHPLSDRVTAAINVYANGGMNSVYRINPFVPLGGAGEAGVDLKQGFVVPSIAVRVADGHSLGVSAVGLVQGFRAYGIQPFAGASADPANFSNRGTDWTFGAGLKIGYLGRIGDRVAIGAMYQSKVHSGRFDRYAGLFADAGSFDVPTSWGLGVSIAASDRLTIAGDFKRIEYSGVESVGNPLSAIFTGKAFGRDGGPGFGWRDVSVYKVGAVYQASDTLTLRAGYGRSDNPVPPSETLVNILSPGVVQDHFTIGASVRLSPNLELSAHALRAPRNTVTGQGSIPSPFGGGEADIRLAETSAGLAVGVGF